MCELDTFLSQAARWYVRERTLYPLCSLDQTSHFFFAAWNTRTHGMQISSEVALDCSSSHPWFLHRSETSTVSLAC